MKYQTKAQIITSIFILFIGILIIGCGSESSAGSIKSPTKETPIAGTAEQQARFRDTFNTQYTRDSVWATAFENAFSNAFGADSLQEFLKRKTLQHIAFSENHEINGTERGKFVINNGVTLTVNGVVYGSITIMKGGFLRNNGAVYGNIENLGGQFEDNGILQGALLMR